MDSEPRVRDPVTQAVYVALFKVVSAAELSGPERAVDWARETLENEQLLQSIAAGTRTAVEPPT